MTTVWKFPVSITDHTLVVSMPRAARVVEVGVQDGLLCMWAIVHSDAPTDARRFQVVGTGHQAPDGGKYVGTAHVPPFVWHLFEVDA
jgi:hypothetical protein